MADKRLSKFRVRLASTLLGAGAAIIVTTFIFGWLGHRGGVVEALADVGEVICVVGMICGSRWFGCPKCGNILIAFGRAKIEQHCGRCTTQMDILSVRRRCRIFAIPSCVLIAVYFVSYVAMSNYGRWAFSQTGKVRYSFGLAMSDVVRWDPAVAHWESFRDINGLDTSRGNPWGYLYSPLIRLDRRFVHLDRPLAP